MLKGSGWGQQAPRAGSRGFGGAGKERRCGKAWPGKRGDGGGPLLCASGRVACWLWDVIRWCIGLNGFVASPGR